MILLKILFLILLTDFITGFVHFILDQYGKPDAKFFKNAIKINLSHHDNPRKMVKRSYWQLTRDSYILGAIIFPISLIWGFHWEILFVLVLGAQANIIHKWAHQTKKENFLFVTFLQKLRIIQNKRHHKNHHRRPFDTYFCVMTNFWNPILEKLRFWEGMVKFLLRFGLEPAGGTNIRGHL